MQTRSGRDTEGSAASRAERAVENAFATGRADCAEIIHTSLERTISAVHPSATGVVCICVASMGTILFSLCVISPLEGIDLGAACAPAVGEAREGTASAAEVHVFALDDLRDPWAASQKTGGTRHMDMWTLPRRCRQGSRSCFLETTTSQADVTVA